MFAFNDIKIYNRNMNKISGLIIGIILTTLVALPVFAKKQGASVYKQGELIKQQVKVYTPGAYQKGDAVQSGIGINGDVIELVVDYSGSMDRWIKLAISTLKSILPKISPDTNVGLRVLGQNSGQSFVTTLFSGCQISSQIVRPAKQNSSNIISGLNKTKIGSATPLTYALKRTIYGDFAGISHKTKKKIVLVTDGEESCGGNPCEFIRTIAAKRKDIVIDVIIVNGSNNLRCLSDATGGRYYNINNAQDFGTAMGVSFETLPPEDFKNSTQNNDSNGSYHYEYIK